MALREVGIAECELIMYETNSHIGYLDFRIWYASCNRNFTILSTWVQVSSDFSILDMDVAFAFGFAAAASMNALTNFAVNACVTWQILFIVFPFTYAARKLQVKYCLVPPWSVFFRVPSLILVEKFYAW